MNNLQIEKILSRVYISKDNENFLGVFPADKIPSEAELANHSGFSIILNTQPSGRPGIHWVAIFRKNKTEPLEYFDSFGRRPHIKHFLKFFNGKKFVYNNIPVQSIFTDVCGQYCIFFILARHFDISYFEIVKLFFEKGDNFVRKFINDYFSLDLQNYDIDFPEKQISICPQKKNKKKRKKSERYD